MSYKAPWQVISRPATYADLDGPWLTWVAFQGQVSPIRTVERGSEALAYEVLGMSAADLARMCLTPWDGKQHPDLVEAA